MKRRILIVAMFAALAAYVSATESANHSKWVGVWQGQLDGQPGVTVTLGVDPGQLAGTVVFNVISREGGQAHVIGSDAHVLTHVLIDGDLMEFQITRRRDSRELHVTMRLTGDGKAQLHCNDCGEDAPVAELVRAH